MFVIFQKNCYKTNKNLEFCSRIQTKQQKLKTSVFFGRYKQVFSIFPEQKKYATWISLIFRKCQPCIIFSMFLTFCQILDSCFYKIDLIKQKVCCKTLFDDNLKFVCLTKQFLQKQRKDYSIKYIQKLFSECLSQAKIFLL